MKRRDDVADYLHRLAVADRELSDWLGEQGETTEQKVAAYLKRVEEAREARKGRLPLPTNTMLVW
jgi:succinate dehydrogenase flavin-adding protein (antitoxin of CptAB toxin-antitoxin module)